MKTARKYLFSDWLNLPADAKGIYRDEAGKYYFGTCEISEECARRHAWFYLNRRQAPEGFYKIKTDKGWVITEDPAYQQTMINNLLKIVA